jgi:glycosyltransferase involved in cell wall biosynthesis
MVSPIKVRHVTLSSTAAGGGVALAVRELAEAQTKLGIQPEIHSLADRENDLGAISVPIYQHAVSARFPFAQSQELLKTLSNSPSSLMHTHGLWSDTSRAVRKTGEENRTPWIVSPHGMLDPWALANSAWKKRIARVLFEDAHLKNAACIHALSQSEKNSIRAFGLRRPICLIPNGVALATLTEPNDPGEKKMLLFLGRIHPKKGLANALKAWGKIPNETRNSWQFVIAGWDQAGHSDELKQLCRDQNLLYSDIPAENIFSQMDHSSVLFVGPAFGGTKEKLLRHADAFILPSFSEGLPIAILEAWSYQLPVLMTDHCNLPEGFQANAAVKIDFSNNEISQPDSIASAFQELFEMSNDEQKLMGKRGRNLVEERFTWARVAEQMKATYEWVLGNGTKPDCMTD